MFNDEFDLDIPLTEELEQDDLPLLGYTLNTFCCPVDTVVQCQTITCTSTYSPCNTCQYNTCGGTGSPCHC